MGFFDGEFSANQLPMIGMIANDPSIDAKRGGMHGMSTAYQQYRPEVAQARMRALNNQMSMWAPVNNALGSMYGPSAQFDMSQATQSPLTDRMMTIGANKEFMDAKEAADAAAKENARIIAADKKDKAERGKTSAVGRDPNKTNATAAGYNPGRATVTSKASYNPGSQG